MQCLISALAVVRSMMLAVKAQLDLADPYEAMIWAYCCTCWQGGRRSGELVRGKARTGRWDPDFDMHRGRVSNELSEDGTVQRTVIALAPDKTDVTGEEGHEAARIRPPLLASRGARHAKRRPGK